MKTVLAALVLSAVTVLPATAGTSYALRGAERNAVARDDAKVEVVRPAAAEAPVAKKVRVVLASPYGN